MTIIVLVKEDTYYSNYIHGVPVNHYSQKEVEELKQKHIVVII